MSTGDAQKFEETFTITSINNEKYDRVSRIFGTSQDNSVTMSLDINHELFTVNVGESVNMLLATSLNLDGTASADEKGWRASSKQEPSLADMYEYVCYGKNYRFEDGENEGVCKFFCSFGGLLLYVEGPYQKMQSLKIENVYMLLKK